MAVELDTFVSRPRRYAAVSLKCRLLLARDFLLILKLYSSGAGDGVPQCVLRYGFLRSRGRSRPAQGEIIPCAPGRAVPISLMSHRGFRAVWLVVSLQLVAQSAAAASPVVLFPDDMQDEFDDLPEFAAQPSLSWVGLYEDAAGASIRPTRISIVRREGASGPYRIVANPPDALFLVAAVPSVVAGPAVTAARNLPLGPDARQVEFMLGTQQAVVRWASSLADGCDATITLSIAGRIQTLFRMDPASPIACDEPHFRIDWAGDLDRDGRLDLLVTFSPKYSVHPRRLLLSSAASAGALVAEVAVYTHLEQ